MSQTHSHHATVADNYQLEVSRWTTGRNVLVFAALLGMIACIAGYFTNPARLFQSYTGGVRVHFADRPGRLLLRHGAVPHRLGLERHHAAHHGKHHDHAARGPASVHPDRHRIERIYPWMNQHVCRRCHARDEGRLSDENFFMLRTVIYFFLWSLWVGSIYHQSTKQDTERSVRQMYIASRWSAPGLFLAVVVGTLASYDWLMSIEPKWYSTIFGLFMLSGGALSFLSMVTLVCLAFRRAGILKKSITQEHYHDLGKWLLVHDSVLHLHGVLAVLPDLVCATSRRNHLVPPPHGGKLAADQSGDAVSSAS